MKKTSSRFLFKTWQDSSLSGLIKSPDLLAKLDGIWSRASEAYPRATWPGWIDHSATHVLAVLRNVQRLIPDYVYKRIQEEEAFVLIASVLLHDIGMVQDVGCDVDRERLSEIRKIHGKLGSEIIRRDFNQFLQPYDVLLNPICEIVANHQGVFDPVQIFGLGYDLRADALLVRLADELDFGPHHAPNWLVEHLIPSANELEHWKRHNKVQEPTIDLEHFRIQVRGVVTDTGFMGKLRQEIEEPSRQDLQKVFLNRGLKKQVENRTFLLLDMTHVEGDQFKEPSLYEARPVTFGLLDILFGGRSLYNLGRFHTALECFEEAGKISSWDHPPNIHYFYHYLQTLNCIGEYQKALEVAERFRSMCPTMTEELDAAIVTSNGIAHWKLGNYVSAIDAFRASVATYSNLASSQARHLINTADAWTLYAITHLEMLRDARIEKDPSWPGKTKNAIETADKYFHEYEQKNPGQMETHYKGRYWGLLVFWKMYQLDQLANVSEPAWDNASTMCNLAIGNSGTIGRKAFGIIAGKYCAACLGLHKYTKIPLTDEARKTVLLDTADTVASLVTDYIALFGERRVLRTWDKICVLSRKVDGELKKQSLSPLPPFLGDCDPSDSTQILTPLH